MCETGTDKCTCPDACTGRDADKDLAVCEAAKAEFIKNETLPGWIEMTMPAKINVLIETALDAIPHWIRKLAGIYADTVADMGILRNAAQAVIDAFHDCGSTEGMEHNMAIGNLRFKIGVLEQILSEEVSTDDGSTENTRT